MDSKDLKSFYHHLDRMNLEVPEVLLISGTDAAAMDLVLNYTRGRLTKTIGTYEATIFTGEPGDEDRFLEEVFNVPLFAPYRLIAVRQGQEVFKPILAAAARFASCVESFQKLPDRTLVLVQYDGTPVQKFLKLFSKRLHHFATRELYPNQVLEAIRGLCKKTGLHLDEEAIHEIKDRVEPRGGSIEMALLRVRDALPPDTTGMVGAAQVSEILFPNIGYNPFTLVDALFRLDHKTVRKELVRFNPATDSLMVILKLILNRANEIRRATAGKGMGMSRAELITLLGLKGRPPFVQDKIFQRLKAELPRFPARKLTAVYDFLILLQKSFRSQVPADKQNLFFQQKILEVFFNIS